MEIARGNDLDFLNSSGTNKTMITSDTCSGRVIYKSACWWRSFPCDYFCVGADDG